MNKKNGKRVVKDLMVKSTASVKGGLLACASGEHIKEGLITVRKAGGTPIE